MRTTRPVQAKKRATMTAKAVRNRVSCWGLGSDSIRVIELRSGMERILAGREWAVQSGGAMGR